MRSFPTDWPVPGAIDLRLHDLPHRSADTEWWYVNSHFETADGRSMSLFAAFFRVIRAVDERTGVKSHAHSVTWALSDASGELYCGECLVDEAAPEMGLERLENNRGSKDPRVNRAMREILEQGKVPLPDRMFEAPVHVDQRSLDLDYGGQRFFKEADGLYRLQLSHARQHVGCDLRFELHKPPIRHGDDGVVRGSAGEDMFYYFVPRCGLTGSVTLDGRTQPITAGQGWYDHEFGGYLPDADAAPPPADDRGPGIMDMAWNWTAIQFDDGTDISAYEIVNTKLDEPVGKWLIVIDADGTRRQATEFEFVPGRTWTSTRTFHTYPVSWRLLAPEIGLDVEIEAAFADQEFITVISKPAFWEGRCSVRGTCDGRERTGTAFIERSGFQHIDDLDDFFSEVGKEVRKSVTSLLSLDPTYEQMRDLIASEDSDHYMDGVDLGSMAHNLLAPIREITDRGGKSWRSYAALACCDVVGGDSREYVQWLAMPELMHVGSLIVDDVQDESELRRGGPTCHLVHGQAKAINSGTAAYFITQHLLIGDQISPTRKLELYDLYFQAMRAGHAGQAIDLGGMEDLMPAAVESGNADALEARILACHRLKTAVPAASLAAMGAVVGGGSQHQIKAIGGFFEALGLAFQIVDDVLNLRGFKGNLKERGEDIRNGVVTLPIAHALRRLDRAEREALWHTLQSRPQDPTVVAATVERLETCGAIEACAVMARELVEAGWQAAEPSLDPSITKIMLRAFGWFVLERHY
jgi:geranylgeranyl pyrophosphate synthase/predicted secreted hydrolase